MKINCDCGNPLVVEEGAYINSCPACAEIITKRHQGNLKVFFLLPFLVFLAIGLFAPVEDELLLVLFVIAYMFGGILALVCYSRFHGSNPVYAQISNDLYIELASMVEEFPELKVKISNPDIVWHHEYVACRILYGKLAEKKQGLDAKNTLRSALGVEQFQ